MTTPLLACAVCFVGTDPVMRDSLNAGILALMGVTTLVLLAFGYFFVKLARRARVAAHLVQEQPVGEIPGRPHEVTG
jgi:hypothetical protein